MRNFLTLLLMTLFMGTWVSAQVKIGDNPQNIDPSSVLELESTDKVLVITRVTTAQMNAIVPTQGALCFNTDLQSVHYFDGAQWVNIGGGGAMGTLTSQAIVNTNGTETIVITPTATGNNLEVAPKSIRSEQIADGGVNGINIQNGSIGPGKLQDDSITEDKLSENSVGEDALDSDDIRVSIFNNDAGYITGANVVSGDAGNALQIGTDSGAFYDETPLMTSIQNNTDAINAIGTPTLNDVLQEGNNALGLTIQGLGAPINPGDAATRAYVDDAITAGGGNPTDELITNAQLTGTDLIITDPGQTWTIPLGGLGGTGTTEVADLTTITGVGTAGDPFKIEPSATNGQFLSTDAAGTVTWADLPPSGGAALFNPATISGTGTAGDEYTLADNGVTTVKILDANVTPIKIQPSATNGQFLSTDAAGAVAWADLPPSGGAALFDPVTVSGTGTAGDEYTVADNGITTVKILDANVTPLKIQPSATNGQFLSTDATGAVAWADLPPSGGAALFDPATIAGTGTAGDEYTVADDGITTAKVLDANITTAKIAPATPLTPAADQVLITNGTTNQVEWAPAGAHSGTARSLFYADATTGLPTTAFNPNGGGTITSAPSLIWDQSKRFNSGALGIGLDGSAQSDVAKVHIMESLTSLVFPLQIQNRTLANTGAGILFSVESQGTWGKGGLVFERTGGWAVGDFHFLQNSIGDNSNPTLADKAFTITSTKDIQLYGGLIATNGLGSPGQVLTSTGAGVQWSAAGGGTTVNVNAPITGDGDTTPLGIAANGITAAEIADGAISGGVAGAIVDGSISVDDLGSNSVGLDEISDDAIGTNEIINGSIALEDLSNMGAANNEVLKWNGTAWAPAADAGGTAYTAGAGLTLTGTDFSVNDLAGEVTGPTSATVIANDAVTTAKIANATILAEDLADMGAANNEVLKWNGTAWAPAADAGGTAYTAGAGLTLTGTDFSVNNLAGDVTGPTTATVIANNAITSNKILDGSITGPKMAINSIQGSFGGGTSVIVAGTIGQADIGANAIGAAEIQSGVVASDEITDNSIVNADINISAAIDGTKVNPDFGAQDIITTGNLDVGGSVTVGAVVVHPDYVFQKYFNGRSNLKESYDFLPLEDIEAFVKKYHHLPGIKSASQVKKEGVWNLSKSNIQNLEKIEELFLHTIEQEKKIKALQSDKESLLDELGQMKKEIEAIKALLKEK